MMKIIKVESDQKISMCVLYNFVACYGLQELFRQYLQTESFLTSNGKWQRGPVELGVGQKKYARIILEEDYPNINE